MYVEFWVEEPSMEAFLRAILPSALGEGTLFDVKDFGDKTTLLPDAPRMLKSYASWMPDDWRIVVLVDEDRQDCRALKARLEGAAADAGLRTRHTHPAASQTLNRIVVEELEAWLFGDPEALRAAYPGISPTLEEKAAYRDPDAIGGGTWEALERELQRAGHYPTGIAKRRVAMEVAQHFMPERNRSRSFQTFWSALTEMISES